MIGPIPTGTLATAQISARIHSGLAVKLPDGRAGRRRTDYHLTLDMAKHIA